MRRHQKAVRVLPACEVEATAPEGRLPFGSPRPSWLATLKLIDFLCSRIAEHTAIGAGHDLLAQALGIAATDH
jgi:hypothetical protein